MSGALTPAMSESWDRDGFILLPGFAESSLLEAMEARVVELVRAAASGKSIGDAYVVKETKLAAVAVEPEDELAKLFRIHRDEKLFRDFLSNEALLVVLESLLGPDIDCFLSQFIAKRPGALGQPWHQDSFYFPFDRGPQVGLWLAVTEARRDNGPLWVVPGSQVEPIHEVVPDARPDALLGYVEIVDYDTSGEIPVLMQPGDLLVFHSHLFHRSTDNTSDISRLAMVYHLASGGTVDQSQERWGYTPPNTDWLPVRRDGRSVRADR
ncbi:MAG: phytanoyl-CoA dioxygenase family protein [Deltaproteobacteria bacterium]|nr:phytanoyl-CoA dioxygenase family protein [Deltaproteobacteria bacterium]